MALNSNELKELQQQLLASNATWQAGPTSLNKLSDDEKSLRLGSLAEEFEITEAKTENFTVTESTPVLNLPESIDLTNLAGATFVNPVEDQGHCKAGPAFAVKATIETTLRVQLNLPYNNRDGYALPILSAADIFFCGCGGNCITGTTIADALKYCQSTGVISDNNFRFDDGNRNCPNLAAEEILRTKVKTYKEISDKQAMKEWLYTKGALTANIQVYEDFSSYTSGVYSPTTNKFVGLQAVSVVGYSDHLKAWKCKNSWGTGWGEEGYFWIAYGKCEVDKSMYSIIDFTSYISYPILKLGDSQRHDQGRFPSVGINKSNSIEVHQSNRESALWYHFGNTVGVWDEGIKYDQGVNPSIAINDNNKALEVHSSQSAGTLWYHLGEIKDGKVGWGPSWQYDDGWYPSVAMSNDNFAVEVHQANSVGRLFYRVGKIDSDGIIWGDSHEYERNGKLPRVAINEHGLVVEVHQSTTTSTCWSTVGQINEKDKTITWQAATKLDDGIYPSVALDNRGRVISVHQSQGPMTVLYQTGILSPKAKKVEWSQSQQYDDGQFPVIAVNENAQVIEFHESEGEYRLWFRTGELIDAKPKSSVKAEQLKTDKELQAEA